MDFTQAEIPAYFYPHIPISAQDRDSDADNERTFDEYYDVECEESSSHLFSGSLF